MEWMYSLNSFHSLHCLDTNDLVGIHRKEGAYVSETLTSCFVDRKGTASGFDDVGAPNCCW